MKRRSDIRYEFEIYMRRENTMLPSSIWKARSANLSYTVLMLFIFSLLVFFVSMGIWYLEIVSAPNTFKDDFKNSFEKMNFYKIFIDSWDKVSLNSDNNYDENYKLFINIFLQTMPFIFFIFSFSFLVPIGAAVGLTKINSYKLDDNDKKVLIVNSFILNLLIMTASSTLLYSFYNIYLQNIYSININEFSFISSAVSKFLYSIIVYAFLFSFTLLFSAINIIDGNVKRVFVFFTIVTIFYIAFFLLNYFDIKYFSSELNLILPIIVIFLLNITFIINSFLSRYSSIKKLKVISHFSMKVIWSIIYYGMCAFIPLLTLSVSFFILLQIQKSLIIDKKITNGDVTFISIEKLYSVKMDDVISDRKIIVLFEGPLRFSAEMSVLDSVLLVLLYGKIFNTILAYHFQVNLMINKVRKAFFWSSIWELVILAISLVIIGVTNLFVKYLFSNKFSSGEIVNIVFNGFLFVLSVSFSFLIGFLNYKKTLLHIVLNSVIAIFFNVILICIFLFGKGFLTIANLSANIIFVQNISLVFGLIATLLAIINIFWKLSGVKFFVDENINQKIPWRKIKYSDRVYRFNCKYEYLSSKKSKYVMTGNFEMIERIDLKIEKLRSKTQILFLKYSLRDMTHDSLSYNRELFESKKNELRILSSYNKYVNYKYRIIMSKNPSEASKRYLRLIRKIEIFRTLDNFDLEIPNEISNNYIL